MGDYSIYVILNNLDLDEQNGYTYYIVDCSLGDIQLTLPTITYDGANFKIHRLDSSSNVLTITPQSGQTINGGSSITVTTSVPKSEYVSYGSDWLTQPR